MINLPQNTELLARRLAHARNMSVEDAVRQALETSARMAGLPLEEVAGDNTLAATSARRARINRIVEEIAAMPVLDRRSPQEIIDDINVL